jgi:hypothetical protein
VQRDERLLLAFSAPYGPDQQQLYFRDLSCTPR